METLENTAVARLIMVSGNLVSGAEYSDILASYGYVEDGLTPNRYDHQVEDGCAIELSVNLESIDVFGDSKDHLNNINYMIQRFGWIDCELQSQTRNVEHMLLARLVNINITKNTVTGDAFTTAELHRDMVDGASDALEFTPAARPSPTVAAAFPVLENDPGHSAEDEALEALEGDFQRIQELTLELAGAREENDRLSQLNGEANRRIETLQRAAQVGQVASQGTPASPINTGLLLFVEKHLMSMLDVKGVFGPELLADLRSSGYALQVKLVPAA